MSLLLEQKVVEMEKEMKRMRRKIIYLEEVVYNGINNGGPKGEREDFIEELKGFFNDETYGGLRKKIYDKKLRESFYNYWSEVFVKGKHKGHIRKFGEKTWNLEKRLDTFLRGNLRDSSMNVKDWKNKCKAKFGFSE